MVTSFGMIDSFPTINFIVYWGVAPGNLVVCMSVVGEYFIELHVILKCILIYMRFHRGLK
jgi:hypothetical protein